MRAFGIILLIVGILMMVFSRINFTTEEKVADIGPLEVSKEKEQTVGWPVYAGGVVMVAGIALIFAGRKRD